MSIAQWVATLKVGDMVAITDHPGHKFGFVTKTFPSGKWVEVDGQRYSGLTGRYMGQTGFTVTLIVPITDTIRDSVKRKRLLASIWDTKWDLLSTEQLDQVVKVTQQEEQGMNSDYNEPWVQCTTETRECLGGCRSRAEHERYNASPAAETPKPWWCAEHGELAEHETVRVHRDEEHVGLCDRPVTVNEDAPPAAETEEPTRDLFWNGREWVDSDVRAAVEEAAEIQLQKVTAERDYHHSRANEWQQEFEEQVTLRTAAEAERDEAVKIREVANRLWSQSERRIEALEGTLQAALAERDALKRDLDAEFDGNRHLRATYGARDSETMFQFIGRLAAAEAREKALRAALKQSRDAFAAMCNPTFWLLPIIDAALAADETKPGPLSDLTPEQRSAVLSSEDESAHPAAEEGPPNFKRVEVWSDGETLSISPGFTTIRACRHCGVLIAGGPNACLSCE